jgi:hypothetical protein
VVIVPEDVAGSYYHVSASFGPLLPDAGIYGNVSLPLPRDGCSAFTGGDPVAGTIALTVRAHPGRLNGFGVLRSKSVLYGAFVWARRALNHQKRRFPARAGARQLRLHPEGSQRAGRAGHWGGGQGC